MEPSQPESHRRLIWYNKHCRWLAVVRSTFESVIMNSGSFVTYLCSTAQHCTSLHRAVLYRAALHRAEYCTGSDRSERLHVTSTAVTSVRLRFKASFTAKVWRVGGGAVRTM